MKYLNNLKVEYKSEELNIKSDNRYLKFRIVPSQLSLWQRLFYNKWHYVYKNIFVHKLASVNSADELLNMIFSYNEARTFITEHQTWGEIVKHQNDVILQARQHFNSIRDEKWDF